MLSAVNPIEVMCHGDFAPYNVVLNGSDAVGIIDFDTLHPGSRLSDVAYAVYRWAPLKIPETLIRWATLPAVSGVPRFFATATD